MARSATAALAASPGGQLALDVLKERLELVAPNVFDELKFDLIGCNSLYWGADAKCGGEPSEVRVRVAGRAKSKADADLIGNEVEALYTNGPAGGCGAVKRTRTSSPWPPFWSAATT